MLLSKLALAASLLASAAFAAPLKVAIIGLEHGHVAGFLNGGALVPAGGALHRPDVQVVAIVEPNKALFDSYSKRYSISPDLYFSSVDAMAAKQHPDAALVFTSTAGHTAAVEQCARRGIHVMMEKPLAVSYRDALAIQRAAQAGHIQVLVDYETTWYRSNTAAYRLAAVDRQFGLIRKVVVRDGHRGPKLINVPPEFFNWLTDPKLNGAGALFDFGCYGADLMTWLMRGQAPQSVTAVTQHLQPQRYPKVEDEADIFLTYPTGIAIVQGSWNWPVNIKNMDIYGETGYVKTVENKMIQVVKNDGKSVNDVEAEALPAPDDDPLHYLAAAIHGDIKTDGSLSALDTNVIVTEILDAARQSASTGRAVQLPLKP